MAKCTKLSRRLATLALALMMVLSLCAVPAAAAGEETFDGASMNPIKVGAPLEFDGGLVINAGDLPDAEDGAEITMTVDGVETKIEAGTYEGEVVLTATTEFVNDKVFAPPPNPDGSGDPLRFRMAAFIEDGILDLGRYIESAIYAGTITGSEANDVEIYSFNDKFNGIMVLGDTKYTINDPYISMVGHGGDDFNGYGAGIYTDGTAEVEVNGAEIITEGAIRTAIWAGGDSRLTVNDSLIYTISADESDPSYKALKIPMMKRVPWALALEGNVRATNVLGTAEATYNDSYVISTGWGALSTDSGVSGTYALTTNNVFAGIGELYYIDEDEAEDYDWVFEFKGELYGFELANSGYVTYSDQGVINEYNDSYFLAPDYVIIHAAGSSSSIFNGGYNYSERFGAMWHSGGPGGTSNGYMNINGGAWYADQIMFLVKGAGGSSVIPTLTVDDAWLYVNDDPDVNYDGVLYQLMESDDAGHPWASEYNVPVEESDPNLIEKLPATDLTAKTTFKNGDYEGDIYNSIISGYQTAGITFDNATITGVISSSYQRHVDENGDTVTGTISRNYVDGSLNETAYLYGGRIVNTASPAINNPVELTLTNGSTWYVTGESYLNKLVIGAESEVLAADGDELVMTVNGVYTAIEAGKTYTGKIHIYCEGEGTWSNPFDDVSEDAWYYKYMEDIVGSGIMTGTTAATFAPETTMSRGMAARLLYNMQGNPDTAGLANPFTDVTADWYKNAVIWAADAGIVTGDGGKYNPNGNITREEMALMFYNYAKYLGADVSSAADLSKYIDAGEICDWALTAMKWANAEGLVTGKTATTLDPDGTATRCEFASMVMRFIESVQ